MANWPTIYDVACPGELWYRVTSLEARSLVSQAYLSKSSKASSLVIPPLWRPTSMIALNTVMICIETKQILFILECLINKNLPKSNPRNNFMYPTYLKSLSFSFLINTIDRRNRVVFLLSVSNDQGITAFLFNYRPLFEIFLPGFNGFCPIHLSCLIYHRKAIHSLSFLSRNFPKICALYKIH